MKKIQILLFHLLLFAFIAGQQGYSQGILNKIKNKGEDKAVDKLFGDDKNKQNTGSDNSSVSTNSGNSSSSTVSNTKGSGLNNTAPDVSANIKDAETAFNGKKYTDARFAVRQAILGIELEIGKNILKGLPDEIDNLPKIDEEDNVTSSGIGFVGLIIERTYRKDDKQLKITIGNDAAMLSAVNMYLSSGAYASTQDQNHKQVTYKEYHGILEYDEGSGYKLSVPFGQSSILVAEGVNFENEQEIMDAANKIDIDSIKKELGEQ